LDKGEQCNEEKHVLLNSLHQKMIWHDRDIVPKRWLINCAMSQVNYADFL